MEYRIYTSEYQRVPELSVYNNNIYRHTSTGNLLLESCDELYGVLEYSIVDEDKREIEFLGCSYWEDGCMDSSDVIVIEEYGKMFT